MAGKRCYVANADCVGARLAREADDAVRQINRGVNFAGKPRSNKLSVAIKTNDIPDV
jgi:hypothetical protein